MASPGTAFALVLNAVVVLAVALGVGYLWLHRDGTDADPVETWYEEARHLAREVQRIEEAPGNRDRIQREVLPLSGRIQGHARAAPADVDERHVTELYRLGGTCSRIGLEHTTAEAVRTGEFIEVKLETLAEDAAALEAALGSRSEGVGET